MSKKTEDKIRLINDRLVQKGLTKFFYGKIIEKLTEAECEMVDDELYEGAAKLRDKIAELDEQFKKEMNEI
jgi:protein-arginine kinase activator protein McsA